MFRANISAMSNLDLMTTAEVASRLGVDVRTVARRVERGELEPAAKLPGKRGAYLFNRDAVEADA